jgi:hypothetical protein
MKPREQIRRIKARIDALGPVLPGSISEQWNVCGTPGCACKDEKNPVKHGPYYQLSFSVKGRSSTMFIKKQQFAEARRRMRAYKTFKQLGFQLVEACVALARQEGLSQRRGR